MKNRVQKYRSFIVTSSFLLISLSSRSSLAEVRSYDTTLETPRLSTMEIYSVVAENDSRAEYPTRTQQEQFNLENTFTESVSIPSSEIPASAVSTDELHLLLEGYSLSESPIALERFEIEEPVESIAISTNDLDIDSETRDQMDWFDLAFCLIDDPTDSGNSCSACVKSIFSVSAETADERERDPDPKILEQVKLAETFRLPFLMVEEILDATAVGFKDAANQRKLNETVSVAYAEYWNVFSGAGTEKLEKALLNLAESHDSFKREDFKTELFYSWFVKGQVRYHALAKALKARNLKGEDSFKREADPGFSILLIRESLRTQVFAVHALKATSANRKTLLAAAREMYFGVAIAGNEWDLTFLKKKLDLASKLFEAYGRLKTTDYLGTDEQVSRMKALAKKRRAELAKHIAALKCDIKQAAEQRK